VDGHNPSSEALMKKLYARGLKYEKAREKGLQEMEEDRGGDVEAVEVVDGDVQGQDLTDIILTDIYSSEYDRSSDVPYCIPCTSVSALTRQQSEALPPSNILTQPSRDVTYSTSSDDQNELQADNNIMSVNDRNAAEGGASSSRNHLSDTLSDTLRSLTDVSPREKSKPTKADLGGGTDYHGSPPQENLSRWPKSTLQGGYFIGDTYNP